MDSLSFLLGSVDTAKLEYTGKFLGTKALVINKERLEFHELGYYCLAF